MWSHGSFYWNELNTRDPEAARNFYGSTLGWLFEPMTIPNGTYWVAKQGDTPVAGIFQMSGPDFEGIPESWFAYIAVDDVDKRVKKLIAAGGKLLRGPNDVPTVGRTAVVQDNAGVRLCFITPTEEQ